MRSHLLLGFVLAGVAGAATAAAPLVVKDGVEISLLPTVGAGADANLIEVTLDVEARAPDAAKRLGFNSLRGVTLVDCRSGANKFLSAEAFADADLHGAGRAWPVSGDWGHPSADSYLSVVTQHVCQGAGAPAGPTIAVTTPPAPAVASVPVAAPVQAATTAPAPSGPLRVTMPGPTVARPAKVVAAAAPKPAVGSAKASTDGSGALAQVSASPTEKGARKVLTALASLIVSPLAGQVDAAEVNGAKVYRASVGGFASTADAKAFCAKAEAVTKSCWVRPAAMRETAASPAAATGKKSG